MSVFGIIQFSHIFGIKQLPIKHVSLKCVDVKTGQHVIFEHPDKNIHDERTQYIDTQFVLGKTQYTLDELSDMEPHKTFYFPIINDCRCHTLKMCSKGGFKISKSIRKRIIYASPRI